MVLFRKLFLCLSSLNLPLKRGLVFHMHHYFWANIRESESHWEVQISSNDFFKRWVERERGYEGVEGAWRVEFGEVLEKLEAMPGHAGKSALWVFVHERPGPPTSPPLSSFPWHLH